MMHTNWCGETFVACSSPALATLISSYRYAVGLLVKAKNTLQTWKLQTIKTCVISWCPSHVYFLANVGKIEDLIGCAQICLLLVLKKSRLNLNCPNSFKASIFNLLSKWFTFFIR